MPHVVFLAFFFAFVIERFVQFGVKPAFPVLTPYAAYVGGVLGVVAALVYNVDFLAALGVVSPIPYAGVVLSGLFIGGGSHWLNDAISLIRGENGASVVGLIKPAK